MYDTISSTSQYQQIVNDHTGRLDTIDSNILTDHQLLNALDEHVREQLSTFTRNLANIEGEQQVQQQNK
jgi:hypothetical protein